MTYSVGLRELQGGYCSMSSVQPGPSLLRQFGQPLLKPQHLSRKQKNGIIFPEELPKEPNATANVRCPLWAWLRCLSWKLQSLKTCLYSKIN